MKKNQPNIFIFKSVFFFIKNKYPINNIQTTPTKTKQEKNTVSSCRSMTLKPRFPEISNLKKVGAELNMIHSLYPVPPNDRTSNLHVRKALGAITSERNPYLLQLWKNNPQ